jgi:glycosyltransferase involved in cell wall biosynthesis
MRVALTSESFLPYLSGVTVSVDALARGLGALGHEVLVVAPRPADRSKLVDVGSSGPEPAYAWLPSYQLPAIAPAGYRMPWPTPTSEAWDRARAFRPDIVHAHSPFVTGLLARRLARAAGAPLTFTHHTRFYDYRHYLGPLAGPGAAATEAYLKSYWAGCAAIVAPSHDLADEIRSRLPGARRNRVHVIPTGIDVDAIRASVRIDPRSAAGWPSDALVVTSLGRLAPEKRPELVLDAFERVAREEPRARLLVIGGGPSEGMLRDRAEIPGLKDRVAFTGQVPRTEALARVAGGDLFVFVSRTETQGLVLAEALAAVFRRSRSMDPGFATPSGTRSTGSSSEASRNRRSPSALRRRSSGSSPTPSVAPRWRSARGPMPIDSRPTDGSERWSRCTARCCPRHSPIRLRDPRVGVQCRPCE